MPLASMMAIAMIATSSPALPDRGRDVWVFRSVLDKRARMVTVALSDRIYAAYDATNCGIYRVWEGGVKFDGAVYTSSHGPQPTSEGKPYLQGRMDTAVWLLDGKPIQPRFRGYVLKGGQVHFKFEIKAGGKTVTVTETPELEGNAFRRDFKVEGLPANHKLEVEAPTLANGVTPPAGTGTRLTIGNGAMAKWGLPAAGAEEEAEVRRGPSAPESKDLAEPAILQQKSQGVSMRIYNVGEGMSKLMKLVEGQSPNVSKVIPTIDLRKAEDFGDLNFDFIAHLDGFVNVPTAGAYEFRLSSDDGSRLTINGEVALDHDGLRSETPPLDGKVNLRAGENSFFLEYFQGQGDQVLRLEWKRPGSSNWELVPATAFTCIDSVRVTAPGKKQVLDPVLLRRPGDARPLAGVHPAYDLATVRPQDFKPKVGGIDFFPDGRMVVCNWEPDGGVYVLDGVTAKNPSNVKVKRVAFGLAEPLGVKVVGKDIFVLQKQELTRLRDLDGDGVIDEYFALANGWGVTDNFHEFAFGLVYEKGYFYGALATAIDPGGASTKPQNKDRGKIVKIDAKTGDYKMIADGLRTPNGIGYGYKGRIYVTDNQGDWLPSSKVLMVKEGAFYGNRSVDPVGRAKTPEYPPVVWLPQGEIGNSPSQPAPINDGPYKGQMIHGDVTHGGIKRVFAEEVGGVTQGAVFRFTQGLEGGVNRLAWGPDGALYVGGIGSTGNWGQEGKERFGLQRLTFNGKVPFEILAARIKANGVELEFTEAVHEGAIARPELFKARQFRYVPTEIYGGPKVDEVAVPVKSVTWNKTRTRAFLELDGLKENHVLYFKTDPLIPSASGRSIWSTEGWYTINKLPKAKGKVAPTAPVALGQLSEDEKQQGFQPLGPGSVRAYRGTTLPSAWKWEGNTLTFTPGTGRGGDVATTEQFADFELRLEWKMSPGGNSGIMIRSNEEFPMSWATGIEYQLLDNRLHPDGRNPLTSAASAYALIAPKEDVTRNPGEWNETRIVARGTKTEHWLNGFKVLEFDRASPEFLKLIAGAKYRDLPKFAKLDVGHICFQDHGNPFSLRNIRIRKL